MNPRGERNDSRYEQFEISSEMIEQELQTVDCEQRQTDRFKDNYIIFIKILLINLMAPSMFCEM